jgi:phosphate-selective porin OprO and OprP
MKYRWSWVHLTVGAVAVLWASSALAQSRDATVRELEKRIDELERQVRVLQTANHQKDQNLQAVDQRVKVLDRKVEVQHESQRDFTHSLPKVDFNYKDEGGLTLKTDDRANRFTVGGWVQADGRYYTTQSPGAPATFLMRRVRPYFEGTIDKYYDFNVMMDFGQGSTVLENAYADINYFPEFRLRAGKFKEPVSLERWQDDRWNEFPERALTVNLVPDRDIGAQFHGKLWHDVLEYNIGVFNGSTDNSATSDLDGNNAKDFSARIFVQPFATYPNEALQGFGLGMGGTYATSEKNIALDTYKTAAQNVFFQYNKAAFPAGNRYRFAPQFYYYTGPFGVLGDFVYNSQEMGVTNTVKGVAVSRTRQVSNYAWAVTGNYVLTGENATFEGIIPRHNFDPRAGKWGAFELVARVDQLVVDQDAFNDGFANPDTSAGWALEWGVGFNWWLSRRLKLQTDYVRTTFHKGAPNGGARKPESAILQELQILF